MRLRELRIVARALGSAITSSPKFFASIQEYGRHLLGVDFRRITREELEDLIVVADRIERFFAEYRATPDSGFYLTPSEITGSEDDLARLRSLLGEGVDLNLPVEQMGGVQDPKDSTDKPRTDRIVPENRRIFVVHGHDHAARDAVARFLTDVGLEPVILSEQPNRGRTIIEKFEGHVDVTFAVILLTPDDRGATQAEIEDARRTGEGEQIAEALHPRARQNVILELGYFVGRLGRSRVAALVSGDVERPSDVDGVVYIPLSRGWELDLIRELSAAQVGVDPMRLFKQT